MAMSTHIPFGTRTDLSEHGDRIASALAESFEPAEIEALDQLGTMITVPADTPLMVEDSSGTEALIVVEGTASVTTNGDLLATVVAGGILGEGALLNPRSRSATVTADSEMILVALTPREFATVMGRCPELGDRIRSVDEARQGD